MKKKTAKAKKLSSLIKTYLKSPFLIKVKKLSLIIFVFIIFGLAAGLYFFRGQFIVALVDGKPISRLSLVRELEKQGGKQVLDELITEILIFNEAKNQNIEISVDEVNQEIKKIEESVSQQGQQLDQLLEAREMTRDDLVKEIRIQKILEELVGKDIKVTDEELDKYIEENKESFAPDIKIEEIKEDIRQQLKQQKLSEEVPLWIESLYDKAKVKYLLEF